MDNQEGESVEQEEEEQQEQEQEAEEEGDTEDTTEDPMITVYQGEHSFSVKRSDINKYTPLPTLTYSTFLSLSSCPPTHTHSQ